MSCAKWHLLKLFTAETEGHRVFFISIFLFPYLLFCFFYSLPFFLLECRFPAFIQRQTIENQSYFSCQTLSLLWCCSRFYSDESHIPAIWWEG